MRHITGLALLALVASCGGEETPGEPAACSGSGIACVWAGISGDKGLNGDGRHRTKTLLYWVSDLEFAPDGTPYILDWNNHMIRRVAADGTIETVVGTVGTGDGPYLQFGEPNPELSPDGARGTDVLLNHPTDLLFLPDGTLLFAAWHNHKLRTLDPATGRVRILCGSAPGPAVEEVPATQVRFNQPKAIVLAPTGEIYVADQRNQRVRRISAGTSPVVDTIVGTGAPGFNGDGPPLETQLNFETGGNPEPSGGLALSADGRTLYVADTLNHRIRVLDLEEGTVIETLAGTGEAGFSGDGGPAASAQLNGPRDLELSADGGTLFVADSENHRIRAVDLASGSIRTVVGDGTKGKRAGVPALEAQLDRPFGLAVRPDGTLYVADTFNSRILEVRP